ncbi:vacuolar sorting-associated 37B [Brachionus plicatilis]|uniref:Vacuolar sorting-associated 37B n=1 Tax=Brachionus plicatilis TaxID=10195 RepID=A0A3M7RFF8_BRAPC|nr:vacuolar sorting-associated 37B [Brachionus plicatilis]
MNFDQQLLQILNSCDKDQLNKYLNDDESADLLVKSMEQYQKLLKEKDDLQSRNRFLAESNLKLEPILNNLKAKLKEKIAEFEQVRKEYLSAKDFYEAHSFANSEFSLNSIYNSLRQNAIKEEESSDQAAEEFFYTYNVQHTDEELANFQRKFLEERTQVHLKKIKADKLKELLPN